jgi:hypothetical protein
MAQADALSGFVMGELAHCGDMTRSKGSNGMAHHALLDVHISCTLHLQLTALKVGYIAGAHTLQWVRNWRSLLPMPKGARFHTVEKHVVCACRQTGASAAGRGAHVPAGPTAGISRR